MSDQSVMMKYQWALRDEFDCPKVVPIKKRNKKFRKQYSAKRFKTLARKIIKGIGVSFTPLMDQKAASGLFRPP